MREDLVKLLSIVRGLAEEFADAYVPLDEKFDEALKVAIEDKDVAILSFYNAIASASKNVPMSNAFTIGELDSLGFEWSRIGTKYLSYMRKFR